MRGAFEQRYEPLPGVAAGHNDRVGFGFTIVGIDQQDLYVEELNPTDPLLYRVGTKWERMKVEREVIKVIRKVFDPEIPVNIYDLGLIYDIDVDPEDRVHVRMTLTAPGCPVAGTLPPQVEQQIEAIPQVKGATVELVWEPQWTKDMMSEAAQLQLGLM